jgi:AraC-like DNA-binding protein
MRIRKRDAKELVGRVKAYLAHGSPARAGLAEIAGAVHVSPSYLAQAFRAIEQMPLYRYALHVRLQRAASLLARYDDLARLAVELGFASHSHFSTTFLRWAGCTPSAYRARMRESGLQADRAACRTCAAVLSRPPKSRLWRPATKPLSEKAPQATFSHELGGDTRIAPNDLRRLAKCPQKGAAHTFAVSESCLPGDDVNRQPPLFHQDPRGLDP